MICGTPHEQSISYEKKFVLDMQQALRMTENSSPDKKFVLDMQQALRMKENSLIKIVPKKKLSINNNGLEVII